MIRTSPERNSLCYTVFHQRENKGWLNLFNIHQVLTIFQSLFLGPRNRVECEQMKTPTFGGSYFLVKGGELTKLPLDLGGLQQIGPLTVWNIA